MIEVKDQLDKTVSLNQFPKRIISWVPSQTELLHHFQLDDKVIGITKFCIHPDQWYQNKERIGGTKNIDLEKVRKLQPDLIIANKEENTPEDIEALMKEFPVYISDVITIQDALLMIRDIGVLTDCEQKAVDLIDDVQEAFSEFPKYQGKVLYFIWRDPYMVCGTQNFIHSIIEKLGFTNLVKEPRYIELSVDQIKSYQPDYIFLSTEPFPFAEKHVTELKQLMDAEIKIVDGEMFSWYGSRMLKMKKYFDQLM